MTEVGPESLIPFIDEYKVSSVLNNDRKVYGKKFLFDGKDETCWNSDQGVPQWIHLKFSKPVTISKLKIQFQGGFAGKECILQVWEEGRNNSNPEEKSYVFTPNDTNSVQEIDISTSTPNLTRGLQASNEFRLLFNSSTDFYGRIIIYYFDIIGYHKS